MSGPKSDIRSAEPLLNAVGSERAWLVNLTRALVRIPTESPTSDTSSAVKRIHRELADLDNVRCRTLVAKEPIHNLVATVRSDRPGRRLVLNGHLDTYPAGCHDDWHDGPFSGEIRNGRLYGRGSCDMKGGVSCLVHVFRILAQHRDSWCGELCLTLAGDEETMGELGSGYLLKTCPDARGDAMLNSDVGSPMIPRIGEKGMIWVNVGAKGKSAHGAHVHRGRNAIDSLRVAMDRLSGLARLRVNTPDEVARVICAAKPQSEPMGGTGESDVLKSVTVNFGRIAGGHSANLVPNHAEANADIRLPMGVSVDQTERKIAKLLDPLPDVRYQLLRRYEPTWTSTDEPIVSSVLDACRVVLGPNCMVNMRVGASDARLFRANGIPSVVCGLTPNNMGGPNEYLEIDELVDVTKIHLLAALNFLSAG